MAKSKKGMKYRKGVLDKPFYTKPILFLTVGKNTRKHLKNASISLPTWDKVDSRFKGLKQQLKEINLIKIKYSKSKEKRYAFYEFNWKVFLNHILDNIIMQDRDENVNEIEKSMEDYEGKINKLKRRKRAYKKIKENRILFKSSIEKLKKEINYKYNQHKLAKYRYKSTFGTYYSKKKWKENIQDNSLNIIKSGSKMIKDMGYLFGLESYFSFYFWEVLQKQKKLDISVNDLVRNFLFAVGKFFYIDELSKNTFQSNLIYFIKICNIYLNTIVYGKFQPNPRYFLIAKGVFSDFINQMGISHQIKIEKEVI